MWNQKYVSNCNSLSLSLAKPRNPRILRAVESYLMSWDVIIPISTGFYQIARDKRQQVSPVHAQVHPAIEHEVQHHRDAANNTHDDEI